MALQECGLNLNRVSNEAENILIFILVKQRTDRGYQF